MIEITFALWYFVDMEKLLKFLGLKKSTDNLATVAEKQLDKNMEVITSLRDYDQGKKDISTDNIKRHLPNIRTAP